MILKSLIRRARRRWIQTGPVPEGPTVLNVFTTDRCNFSCTYCSRNLEDSSTGVSNRYEDRSEFRLDDLETLLDRYPSIAEVSFVGIGEPFLVPDLLPMARRARARGKRTLVITNGSLFGAHWGEIATAFDSISVSLHAFSATELKAVARVRESLFEEWCEDLRRLVAAEAPLNPDLEISASVVMKRSSLERAEAAAGLCASVGFRALELHNYLPYGLDDATECLFDDDVEAANTIAEVKKRYRGRLSIAGPVLVRRDESRLSRSCISFFHVLRADGLGQVSGCNCIMVPRAENGNWRDDPAVWENAYFHRLRSAFRSRAGIPECCRYCAEAQ